VVTRILNIWKKSDF